MGNSRKWAKRNTCGEEFNDTEARAGDLDADSTVLPEEEFPEEPHWSQVCKFQPATFKWKTHHQRCQGSGFQHPKQAEYQNVKTSRNEKICKRKLSNCFVVAFAVLQSCPKDAEEGIGHFPRLKDAAVEVKRESKYHVISLLTCTKGSESHQRIQYQQ